MIDDQNRLIFVENPKSATYAIKCALYGEDHIHMPGARVATINHDTPPLIRSKHPAEWRSYTKFVVVRNTWDRAHSFFGFYCQIANSESYQAMSFDDWVAVGCPPPDEDHLRAFMRAQGRFDDVLCQLRYCEELDNIMVLHGFDHHSRCLELQEGLKRVCLSVGMAAPAIPVDKNNFGRSDKPIRWKRETIDRLMVRYEEEIKRFDFQLPAQHV